MNPEDAHTAEAFREVVPLAAIEAYEVEPDAVAAADAWLDRMESALLLARGRTLHARFLADRVVHPDELSVFERAAALCVRAGDVRGQAEAEFWIGTAQQTRHADTAAARVHLERARDLARQVGDNMLLSCVERHLGFLAIQTGRLHEATPHLEASVTLRRQIGFSAGVAGALLALAELALDTQEAARGLSLLDEAAGEATAAGAARVLALIDAVRERIAPGVESSSP